MDINDNWTTDSPKPHYTIRNQDKLVTGDVYLAGRKIFSAANCRSHEQSNRVPDPPLRRVTYNFLLALIQAYLKHTRLFISHPSNRPINTRSRTRLQSTPSNSLYFRSLHQPPECQKPGCDVEVQGNLASCETWPGVLDGKC